MLSQELEKVRSIVLKRHQDPIRTTHTKDDLDKWLDVNSKLKTSQSHKDLNSILLKLFFNTGLRVSEVCKLRLADIDLCNRVIHVIHGKHGKSRTVAITQSLYPDLKDYLENKRGRSMGSNEMAFLLPGRKKLTRDRIEKRMKIIANKLGVSGGCHPWRRAFVTHFSNQGVPLTHLRVLCGHADIKTTQMYCNPDEQMVIENMKGVE